MVTLSKKNPALRKRYEFNPCLRINLIAIATYHKINPYCICCILILFKIRLSMAKVSCDNWHYFLTFYKLRQIFYSIYLLCYSLLSLAVFLIVMAFFLIFPFVMVIFFIFEVWIWQPKVNQNESITKLYFLSLCFFLAITTAFFIERDSVFFYLFPFLFCFFSWLQILFGGSD